MVFWTYYGPININFPVTFKLKSFVNGKYSSSCVWSHVSISCLENSLEGKRGQSLESSWKWRTNNISTRNVFLF